MVERQLSSPDACPQGFVIPDDPTSTHSWYPNKTLSECAFRCDRFIMYTESEWNRLKFARIFIEIVTLLLCCGVWQLMKLDRKRKSAQLTKAVVLYSIGIALFNIFGEFDSHLLCRNNANLHHHGSGYSFCEFSGFIELTLILFLLSAWLIQAVAVLFEVVLGWRVTATEYKRSLISLSTLSLIAAITSAAAVGFEPDWISIDYCHLAADTTLADYTAVFVVVYAIVIVCIVTVVCKLVSEFCALTMKGSFGRQVEPEGVYGPGGNSHSDTSGWTPLENEAIRESKQMLESLSLVEAGSAGAHVPQPDPVTPEIELMSRVEEGEAGGSIENKVPVARTSSGDTAELSVSPHRFSDRRAVFWLVVQLMRIPISFLVCFLIPMVLFLLVENDLPEEESFMVSAEGWGQCVLSNYSGEDGSWLDACGAHPSVRVSFDNRMLMLVGHYGQGFFVALFCWPIVYDSIVAQRQCKRAQNE